MINDKAFKGSYSLKTLQAQINGHETALGGVKELLEPADGKTVVRFDTALMANGVILKPGEKVPEMRVWIDTGPAIITGQRQTVTVYRAT